MDLSELNPEQLQAVTYGAGPILVVAGAGTGKTRVITHRIAHLIETKAARPNQVLALTFTEKAAREMADRLYDLIGWESYQVPVVTFNAFGAELLGAYASHIGRSTHGGLINDTQKALLLQQHLDRVSLSYYGPHASMFEFLEGVVEYLGRLQNAGVSAKAYAAYAASLKPDKAGLHPQDITEQHDLSQLYSLYESLKAETGTYDFNDQLAIPLQILQQKSNLAERLTKQYHYVLVDEYQDTNRLQDELLRTFIPQDGNIFAVGDDDQAIYGFRGAQISNILDFTDHYKPKKPLVLTQNYRSGQQILDAAYRLIVHNNPDRLEAKLGLNKHLQAQHKQASVAFQAYPKAVDELEGLREALSAQIAGGATPASIAVLSATHVPLLRLAKQLRAHELPYALSTRVSIFDQPELNQLWYLLQWVGLKADPESIAHVMLSRFIGWDSQAYRELLRKARAELVEVEDVLRTDDSEHSRKAIAKLDEWRSWMPKIPVSVLTYRLMFETEVKDQLLAEAKQSSYRIRRVFEDLGQLLTQMQDYETVAADPTLLGYLAHFPKPPTIEVTEPQGSAEGIQLLTIHASKGLEFDSVYLLQCTRANWSPRQNRGWLVPESLRPQTELPPDHELRRLLYVAATRARKQLVVSAPMMTASGAKQTVSPLVEELLGEIASVTSQDKLSSDVISGTISALQRFYPLRQKQETRLPFETTDGWLELNVSALGGYDFCPYDFYLEHVLSIAQPFGPQLHFGTLLHKLLQDYYQAKLHGEEITQEELLGRLQEQWTDQGYQKRQQAETAKQLAATTLVNFLQREQKIAASAEINIMASELPFNLEIKESKLRINGRIDAVFTTPEGIELRDFKTGHKTDPEALSRAAKTSFQLRTYALAYQEMTDRLPDRVSLDYVVTGTIGSSELSPRIIDNHRAKLTDLAAAIRSRDFTPKPSNVHQCAAIRYYGTGEEDERQLEAARA
ncbi:MAG TPA: ATP-dependent DNA helicase [Candidatus Saccharimonadia bacterium]